MTCSNGNECASLSNLTSSFAIQGSGLSITQTHNITISGQNFTIRATGANFTNATASAHSAAYSSPKPGLKLMMLIGFLLFSAQAFAATSTSAELAATLNQYDPVLESILDPLQVAMCNLVNGAPVNTLAERISLEINVLEVCLEDLMITILGLVGSLVDATATAYGSPLPINDPDTLFAAAAGDSILCLDVAQAILNDPSGNTAAEICAPILASAPPSTATAVPTAATATGSASTSTATSDALPPSWPAMSFFTGEGQCFACRLSQYLFSVQANGDCSNPDDPNENPNAGMNITNPPVTGYDIMEEFCGPTWRAAGLQAACDYFCANTCERWFIQALINSMGSAYIPQGINACLDQCGSTPDGTGEPAYCTGSASQDTCECGAGMLSCYPLDPATGTCYN